SVFDKQAAHLSRVAEVHYVLDAEAIAECPARKTWEFLCASLHWHSFLGFELGDRHIINMTTGEAVNEESTRGQGNECNTLTPDFIRRGLRQLYGQSAHFKSQEQALAVSRVLGRDSPLLVVLPTGGGKTDIWLLPIFSPHARITVVITPLTALTQDLAMRVRKIGIPTYIYQDPEKGPLRPDPPFYRGVVLATTESA
ncbi:hypothetical protein L211DRAFT_750027, partial [Terfezia boudieri ATCC MYA-4762]